MIDDILDLISVDGDARAAYDINPGFLSSAANDLVVLDQNIVGFADLYAIASTAVDDIVDDLNVACRIRLVLDRMHVDDLPVIIIAAMQLKTVNNDMVFTINLDRVFVCFGRFDDGLAGAICRFLREPRAFYAAVGIFNVLSILTLTHQNGGSGLRCIDRLLDGFVWPILRPVTPRLRICININSLGHSAPFPFPPSVLRRRNNSVRWIEKSKLRLADRSQRRHGVRTTKRYLSFELFDPARVLLNCSMRRFSDVYLLKAGRSGPAVHGLITIRK